jgi:hypothetical protein
MTSDATGNLYLVASVNRTYKFSPGGNLLIGIGANTNTRTEDGSELLHSVAVDSQGNMYSMTWGNPGLVTKSDAAATTVTQRAGQFKWADNWSTHSSYTPVVVDRNDRLWVGVTTLNDPASSNYNYYHFSPAVLPTTPDFLNPSRNNVTQRSAWLLDLSSSITTQLPYDIAYDLTTIPVTFVVDAAFHELQDISVSYRVQDVLHNEITRGSFELPLQAMWKLARHSPLNHRALGSIPSPSKSLI